MFDRRKEKHPVQFNNDRRVPVLTENRMQLIWKIVSQEYVDKLQKFGPHDNWANSD